MSNVVCFINTLQKDLSLLLYHGSLGSPEDLKLSIVHHVNGNLLLELDVGICLLINS